jgi:hypothetical protein
MGKDENDSDYPVCESVNKWGIFCKDIPFKMFEKVKDPAKRSWYDEDGDDEFIPKDGLRLEAYTMKVEFACKKMNADKFKKAVEDVRANIADFLSYLRQGQFKLYSSYTRIGRQNVRLESVSDNAKWRSDEGGEYLIFEVVFKVNDPVTDVVYNNVSLV